MEQQADDEPNTPSKSKMMPRRPLSFYAIILLFAFVIGKLHVTLTSGNRRQPELRAASIRQSGSTLHSSPFPSLQVLSSLEGA